MHVARINGSMGREGEGRERLNTAEVKKKQQSLLERVRRKMENRGARGNLVRGF